MAVDVGALTYYYGITYWIVVEVETQVIEYGSKQVIRSTRFEEGISLYLDYRLCIHEPHTGK